MNKLHVALQLIYYVFVWNNKPDKINRKTVIKSIDKVGLGLPDIKSYISALKLSRLRKIKSTSHKWTNVINAECPFINELENYGPNLAANLCRNNIFWKHVFEAFKSFFYKVKVKSKEEILAEPIFHNERIQVGKSTLKHKHWINKGIVKVVDLFDENGEFYNYEDFKLKYNLHTDFISYTGCKLAVKEFISKNGIIINDNRTRDINIALLTICSVSKGTRLYYDILTSDDIKPKCCDAWEQKLSRTIQWKSCFYLIQKIQDTNLKWFQMRIIHRILGTNIVLKEMGIIESNNCSFCNLEKERIQHLFWSCNITQQFWMRLENLFNSKCELAANVKFSEDLVLFGTQENVKTDPIFDFIIMYAKQYIFSCKVKTDEPNITSFKKILHARYKTEEYNSKIEMNPGLFAAKWHYYKPMFLEDL